MALAVSIKLSVSLHSLYYAETGNEFAGSRNFKLLLNLPFALFTHVKS